MDQEQIKEILRLGRIFSYTHANESYLNKIENDLYEVIKQDNENKKAIETLARFLFERQKYQQSLKQFCELSKLSPTKAGAYYGMYKCNVMIGNYIESFNNIKKYISIKNNNDIKEGTEIIISLYDSIINNKYGYKIKLTENFIMNKIADEELKQKYFELIKEYNLGNYSKCISLAKECEIICRSKNIKIEFLTLIRILEEANEKVKQNMNKNMYKVLQDSLNNNDLEMVAKVLYKIPKIGIKNEILVYNSIYKLIKNNYIDEATKIIDTFFVTKENKTIIRTLKNCIQNQMIYNNMSDNEKEMYNNIREKGHECYISGNIKDAYYMYLFGLENLKNPIFLYYIGKMLYKLRTYKEAENYFEQYIKIGSEKNNKAYLYLSIINKKKYNFQKAEHYYNMMNLTNKIYDKSNELDNFYICSKDDNYQKMKVQRKRNK